MSNKGGGMFKGGLVVAALVAALFIISGCGGSSPKSEENAHIDENTGSTHDLVPDERTGPAPPPEKVTDLRKAATQADCFLRLGVKAKNVEELNPGAPTPSYPTDPPVSGPYVKPPYQQADGAYLNTVDAIDQLGALNQGRMTIQYAPDLPEKIQLELKGLYDTMYGATLFFPNDEMQFAVAVTTWSNFLGCTAVEGQGTLDAIRAFGKATWGKSGSKPVKTVRFEGPTPASPEEPESGK
ncbi:MAG TPA: DUF3105 domain-containing protein [Solirubrobacterales bacterium]|jgi:hypothetical protein|nr:DUF3105 domain-containing protein [Solirubrobacterales bacterium]